LAEDTTRKLDLDGKRRDAVERNVAERGAPVLELARQDGRPSPIVPLPDMMVA
jgi:hypothetical protein